MTQRDWSRLQRRGRQPNRRVGPPQEYQPLPNTPWTHVRDFVLEARWGEQGCLCPVCGDYNKVREMSLTPIQAIELYVLYRVGVGYPIHYTNFCLTQSKQNYYLLRYYGFIQDHSGDEGLANASGFWSITESGRQFVNGQFSVPRYLFVIHNDVIGRSDEMCTFQTIIESDDWVTPAGSAYADLRPEDATELTDQLRQQRDALRAQRQNRGTGTPDE